MEQEAEPCDGHRRSYSYFGEKRLFSEAVENVYHEVPEEMNGLRHRWTNLISSILRLPKEEHMYVVRRRKFLFKLLM